MKNREIVIIGGGLAGLTAAIHLSQKGHNVTVIEKNDFPKHKVCGEYISNEVLPYLKSLNIDLSSIKPTNISELEFSTVSGKIIRKTLPLGGFGISRYALDEILCNKALHNGCEIIKDSAESVVFNNEKFTVVTAANDVINASIVIGAFGKRSIVDQKLNRDFIKKKSPWLAVKAHYKGEFPNNLVGLHNFEGGYCGVSKVENNIINICYLADYETFKKYKNIDDYQQRVLMKNPYLKAIFENSIMLFDKPLTISQVSFEEKQIVENHILMIGDTAGLIHPLCGNGMAMAIHSAKIVAELVGDYLEHNIHSRKELERIYTKEWNSNFSKRLAAGRFLSNILQKNKLSEALMRIMVIFPFLLPIIIKKTHGKPIILRQ